MDNTTNLPPTAQAVLEAANGASSYGPDDILNDTLSPAAQAVMDAFVDSPIFEDEDRIAAVLRAAADQVVPPDPFGYDCCITQCEQIRAELLAIVAELEGRFTPPCLFQEKAV